MLSLSAYRHCFPNTKGINSIHVLCNLFSFVTSGTRDSHAPLASLPPVRLCVCCIKFRSEACRFVWVLENDRAGRSFVIIIYGLSGAVWRWRSENTESDTYGVLLVVLEDSQPYCDPSIKNLKLPTAMKS